MQKPNLITLSGIDCAGKSTQIALLEGALRSAGKDVRVFWFRPGYSTELDRLRALVRRVRPGALPRVESAGAARDRAFANPAVRHTWLAMAALDTAVQYGIKLRRWLANGSTVVCDRYVHDGVLDLALKFPELISRDSTLARWLVTTCPEPDCALLLMLPRATMLERMKKKLEPFADSESVRTERYLAYQRLATSSRFHVINADQPIDRVHGAVMEAVATSGAAAADTFGFKGLGRRRNHSPKNK